MFASKKRSKIFVKSIGGDMKTEEQMNRDLFWFNMWALSGVFWMILLLFGLIELIGRLAGEKS